MASLVRENMAEDIKKRFDVLTNWEQQAIEALMESEDYSIEEALDIVESGKYEFYPGLRAYIWRRMRQYRPGLSGEDKK